MEKVWKRRSWLLLQQFDEWWLFWGPPVLWVHSHRSQKKVWNNSADLSSWDFVPCTICTQDHRGTHTKKHLWRDQEKHLPTSLTSPSGVFVIYTGIVNDLLKSFSSSNRVQYDMFLELAEATTEIETSLLLTGLVINCYVCLFVMTLNTEMSDPSRANMSQ